MPNVPLDQDAFGRALLDHLEGRPVEELRLEVDDGWSVPAMSPAWFFQQPAHWSEWERGALAGLAGPVLDLGTGAGRASLHLQTRGVDVVAVDSSPGAVEVCRRRGVEEVRVQDFLEEVPGDRDWNAVLLLCGNLGLAGGWEATRRLLRALHARCAPGAMLIADTVDPTVGADEHALQYQKARLEAGDYVGDVTLRLVYGAIASPWWRQTNFVVDDVPRLVDGTGWGIEQHHVSGVDHYLGLRRS